MSAPEISSGWDGSFEVPDAATFERLAALTRIQTRQIQGLGEDMMARVYGFAIEQLRPGDGELPGFYECRPVLYRALSVVRHCVDGGGVQFNAYHNDESLGIRVPLYQHRGYNGVGTYLIEALPPMEDEGAVEVAEAIDRLGQICNYRLLGAIPDLTTVLGYAPKRRIVEVV